ncbi:MAG: hypothetical protein M0R46_12640 [Candidatus Muirbacterium halophilum]|nr:hypothetical protein [Candidatus Muirbacterium halophilum]
MKIIVAIKNECFDIETLTKLNNKKFYGLGDVVKYLKDKGLSNDDFTIMNSNLFFINVNYNILSDYKIIFLDVKRIYHKSFHFKIGDEYMDCKIYNENKIIINDSYIANIDLALPHISNNDDIVNFMKKIEKCLNTYDL